MVLYFTGTGNSRHAAEIIAKTTGDGLVSLNGFIKSGETLRMASEKPWVIVTPTHGWRIPRAVEELLRASELTGSKKAYFVMTCGTDTGNASAHLAKLCAALGLEYMGLAGIEMPENYIAMFSVPEPEEARRIVSAAEPVIRRAAEAVAAGERLPERSVSVADRLKSGVVNSGFRAFCISDRKFRVKDNCVGCGKCASVCPVNDVTLVNRRPVWAGKCIHCMACICSCPTEAIEYGEISVGKPRYFLPASEESEE